MPGPTKPTAADLQGDLARKAIDDAYARGPCWRSSGCARLASIPPTLRTCLTEIALDIFGLDPDEQPLIALDPGPIPLHAGCSPISFCRDPAMLFLRAGVRTTLKAGGLSEAATGQVRTWGRAGDCPSAARIP
jgi:hypothetical protein